METENKVANIPKLEHPVEITATRFKETFDVKKRAQENFKGIYQKLKDTWDWLKDMFTSNAIKIFQNAIVIGVAGLVVGYGSALIGLFSTAVQPLTFGKFSKVKNEIPRPEKRTGKSRRNMSRMWK